MGAILSRRKWVKSGNNMVNFLLFHIQHRPYSFLQETPSKAVWHGTGCLPFIQSTNGLQKCAQRFQRIKTCCSEGIKWYNHLNLVFNWLAPGRCCNNFTSIIFNLKPWNRSLANSCVNALMWMPHNLTNEKSTLAWEMAWCHQAKVITWANVDPDLCSHRWH